MQLSKYLSRGQRHCFFYIKYNKHSATEHCLNLNTTSLENIFPQLRPKIPCFLRCKSAFVYNSMQPCIRYRKSTTKCVKGDLLNYFKRQIIGEKQMVKSSLISFSCNSTLNRRLLLLQNVHSPRLLFSHRFYLVN